MFLRDVSKQLREERLAGGEPRRREPRRGVLLLVVLSLLSLFSVVVITYVMIAGVTRRAATAAARADFYATPPEELGQRLLMDLLRGTHNPMSPLQGHDILGDLYGEDWVECQAAANPRAVWMDGQVKPLFVQVPFVYTRVGNGFAARLQSRGTANELGKRISTLDGYYNGLVLTFLEGPLAGQSRRIVDYFAPESPTPGDLNSLGSGLDLQAGSMVVEAFDLAVNTSAARDPRIDVDQAIQQAMAGRRFLINGRPFNGTGEGYDPQYNPANPQGSIVGFLDPPHGAGKPPRFYAWMPNWRADNTDTHNTNYRAELRNRETGGVQSAAAGLPPVMSLSDEDYDAVDHNNMFLAMLLPQQGGHSVPIPSFFRPDLVIHWATTDSESWQDPNFRQRVLMRPIKELHPEFRWNNPEFEQFLDQLGNWGSLSAEQQATLLQAMVDTPPWDVDNDGDGKMDSLWLDPGYEVYTAPDGRRYKVLMAPLIVDLNGRLNVNAHGSLAHVQNNGTQHDAATLGLYGGAAGVPLGDRPRGMGVGPADVDLAVGGVFSRADYGRLLTGAQVRGAAGQVMGVLPGRYGEANLTDAASGGIPRWIALAEEVFPTWGVQWNRGQRPNVLAERKHWHMPQLFPFADIADPNRPIWYDCSYQTPTDPWGSGTLWTSGRGAPIYRRMAGFLPTGPRHLARSTLAADPAKRFMFSWNNPYEFDLSRERPSAAANGVAVAAGTSTGSQPQDAPFTVTELEKLLRFFDKEQGNLPDRLLQLAPTTFGDPRKRQLVTTTSWDLPVVSVHAPSAEAAKGLALVSDGQVQPMHLVELLRARMPNLSLPQFNRMVRFYLAPEILAGRKLDLNRPFGDGVDSDGDGVIDEPDEAAGDAAAEFIANSGGVARVPSPFYHNNGQTLDPKRPYSDPVHRLHARQIMARHLYILARVLVNDNFSVTPRPGESNEQARARVLAQWAINVVDFRDRDSIISYFEYDVDPFTDADGDGTPWDVDGDPTTVEGGSYRALVWGAERPELLITETLATHDRRTADELNDDGIRKRTTDNPPDPTFDQVRRPQGNLLVELYNPQNHLDAPSGQKAWNDPASKSLYARSTQDPVRDLNNDGLPDFGVNLAAIGGDRANPAASSPVWRLAVSRRLADDLTVDPTYWELPPNHIERVAYFVDATRTQGIQDGLGNNVERFGLPNGTVDNVELLVRPGYYAVIGPSSSDTFTPDPEPIHFGLREGGADTTSRLQNKYPRTVFLDHRLNFGGTRTVDNNNNELPGAHSPAARKPALGVKIAPVINQVSRRKLRFSISEPLGGYPIREDIGGRMDDDNAAFNNNFPDIPFDDDPTWWEREGNIVDVFEANSNKTLPEAVDSPIGYKRVYLQRLANPGQSYDPRLNPYITVDYLDVDLTIYNSEPNASGGVAREPLSQGGEGDVRLDSRRRGSRRPRPPFDQNSIWSPWIAEAPDGPAGIRGTLHQPIPLQTLGFLNDTFGGLQSGGIWLMGELQQLASQGRLPGVALLDHAGDPKPPPQGNGHSLPWFPWHNRPYLSEMELLLVPRGGPAEQLAQHSVLDPSLAGGLYSPSGSIGGPQATSEFHHLLNMFHSLEEGGVDNAPHFYRLLEYCHVPSPFVGTEEVLPGSALGAPSNSVAEALRLRPPFNVLSRYREPGRVNINTVFDPLVWLSLTDAAGEPSWTRIVASRRGFAANVFPSGDTTSQIGAITPQPGQVFWPFFARPFRSFAGGELRPGKISATLSGPALNSDRRSGVQMTLLRAADAAESSSAASNIPLFESMGLPQDNRPYRNARSDPYFRYHALQRTANLLTTHSNQFAVWLTMGYFEVIPLDVPNDATQWARFPDGYRLGRELGSDTGSIRRHRMFYIIDRTIPVGYRRGENNNVRETVLLERFIE